MMSAQSEAWQIMNVCLGMTYGKDWHPARRWIELTLCTDEIGDVFAKWNADGELVCKLLLLGFYHRADLVFREAHS